MFTPSLAYNHIGLLVRGNIMKIIREGREIQQNLSKVNLFVQSLFKKMVLGSYSYSNKPSGKEYLIKQPFFQKSPNCIFKIVTNSSRTYDTLHCKGEPYCFSSQRGNSEHTQRQTQILLLFIYVKFATKCPLGEKNIYQQIVSTPNPEITI